MHSDEKLRINLTDLDIIKFSSIQLANYCTICSVSHQLSTRLLPAFISPERSITLTKGLHRNNHLGRLCLHTKLYAHIFFGHAYRAGRKLTSNNHLPDWYFNHRITITLHVSIIGKLNKTAPSSPYSVMENSKKYFRNPLATMGLQAKNQECRMVQAEIVNF